MKLKERARKLKTDIPALFLALKDKDTPAAAKLLAAVTVGYALSPVDLIPDFIPVLGYLDDLILLPALIALTVKLIPEEILGKCRKESEGMWQDGKPERWYYAIPVIVFWVIVLLVIAKAILF
ncbi:MAG: YkvA family protein [Oscillospiraceae bacterium]